MDYYHGVLPKTVAAKRSSADCWLQVVEYVTLQIVNGYKAGNTTIQSILDSYDFYIFPVVNPDGELQLYVLSQINFPLTKSRIRLRPDNRSSLAQKPPARPSQHDLHRPRH